MIVLITGTSRGIGNFLAQKFIDRGDTVIGFSRTQADITSGNYSHYCADITDEKQVRSALADIRKKYGYIDALINNAGIAAMNHFCLTPLNTARKVMDVNFFGTFLMTRECVKLLRKSSSPRIVNFSTVAVPLNLEGELVYAASKSAVETLTRTAAKELSSYHITVNAVGPVPVKTALIAGVPEDKLNGLLERQAVKRYGEKADVWNVIDFYLRPESDFVTGQVIYLGGIN